jgi:hypothetical protein
MPYNQGAQACGMEHSAHLCDGFFCEHSQRPKAHMLVGYATGVDVALQSVF